MTVVRKREPPRCERCLAPRPNVLRVTTCVLDTYDQRKRIRSQRARMPLCRPCQAEYQDALEEFHRRFLQEGDEAEPAAG